MQWYLKKTRQSYKMVNYTMHMIRDILLFKRTEQKKKTKDRKRRKGKKQTKTTKIEHTKKA